MLETVGQENHVIRDVSFRLPPGINPRKAHLHPEGQLQCRGAIMSFNDQSRNCHAERSEASLCRLRQPLREVYPGRSEWAQGDKPLPILLVKNHYRALR
jgi:hypothetical protein